MYATPEAARQAVTDRLRQHARPNGAWALADLQRQYAYDQLVDRLYRVHGGWVVKGATALLARRLAVRHTTDIDVYRAGSIADVERDVRRAAGLQIGDWMRFELGAAVRVKAAGADATRIKVEAFMGTKVWASFQVDVVADGGTGAVRMTGVPEQMPPLTNVDVTGEPRALWRTYPLVDHVADKVCAILERHDGRPSTRYKDLVDLVAIVRTSPLEAALQREALVREADRRRLMLPMEFAVPDLDCGRRVIEPRLRGRWACRRSASPMLWRA